MANVTFTIITPLLNRAGMLPDMFASLSRQGAVRFEHLVVDGGSTDGSQDIARQAGAQVIDAPGTSIYEALNIGIQRAEGNVVGFLNSDDRLADDTLKIVEEVFGANPDADVVSGYAVTERLDTENAPPVNPRGEPYLGLPLHQLLFQSADVNACFFRKRLFTRIGMFDPQYRIAADRELLVRAAISRVPVIEVPKVLYVYREHAGSLTIGISKPAERRWVDEHLRFAQSFLASTDLKDTDRRELHRFVAKETLHACLLSVRDRAPKDISATLRNAFRNDPLWFRYAIFPVADKLFRATKIKKHRKKPFALI